jgi:hypothetical protein
MAATILSYGMDVESTAILVRWILEPKTRPGELSDLIVISAQVGDEYLDTCRDVETHILPLMRQHGIRYVQVARHGHLKVDGITVLDDTRAPTSCHIEGDYKLSDELRRMGTVPQSSGTHRCALKFKAFVIERWLTDNVRGAAAHAIGYNASETGRIANSEYAFDQRKAPARADRAKTAAAADGPAGEKIAFGFNADETGRIARNSEYNTFTRTAFRAASSAPLPAIARTRPRWSNATEGTQSKSRPQ